MGLLLFSDISQALKCGAILSDEAVKYGSNYYDR
jgi:hypothetical protein